MGRSADSIVIALAAVILAAVLGGCLGQHQADSAPPRIAGATCHGAIQSICLRQGDTLVLSNVTLSSNSAVGLLIEDLTTSVKLRNVIINGSPVGLEIASACEQCQVTLENVSVAAGDVGILVGTKSEVRGLLTLGNSIIANARVAFEVRQYSGIATLRNVAFSSESRSDKALVALQPQAALVAANVSIKNFERGIVGSWQSIYVRNVVVACIGDAIWASQALLVDIDGLVVDDCAQSVVACEENFSPIPAIFLTAPLENGAPQAVAKLQNLRLSDYDWGIWIQDYSEADLRNVSLKNGTGGLHAFVENLTLANAEVQGHQRVGVLAGVDFLNVENLTALNNGYSCGGRARGGLEVQASHSIVAGEYLAPLTVRNSTFVGNSPFGLTGNGDVVDASGNWWGSPLGPSPATPAALGSPRVPGYGDMVEGTVISEPHLAAPP